jgi:dihydrofolate reductase
MPNSYTISLVVAASANHAIGLNNALLWHLPNDLRFFKNTTWGAVVIMGRKTFEAVSKPLPGRINIVVTRNEEWNATDVCVAGSLEDAIDQAKKTNCREIFVIGGAEIYALAMPIAQRIYLTRVHADLAGDAFFPPVDNNLWQLVHETHFAADDKHAFPYSFQTWERI